MKASPTERRATPDDPPSHSSDEPSGAHPVDQHVGAVVRTLRSRARLSQTALAEAIGVSFQQVQKYERGANRISASMLYDIACVLRVPMHVFFVGLPAPDEHHNAQEIAQLVALPHFAKSRGGARLLHALTNLSPRSRLALTTFLELLPTDAET